MCSTHTSHTLLCLVIQQHASLNVIMPVYISNTMQHVTVTNVAVTNAPQSQYAQ
jgi:hypothetical protein